MSGPDPSSTVDDGVPFGVSVPFGAAAVAAVCLLCGALPAGGSARVWLPALAVGAIAYVAEDVRAGAVLAGIGFLLVDGFLENRAGELSWHAGDLPRLGLMLACGVLGATPAVLRASVESRRARLARRRLDRELMALERWANSGVRHERGEEAR